MRYQANPPPKTSPELVKGTAIISVVAVAISIVSEYFYPQLKHYMLKDDGTAKETYNLIASIASALLGFIIAGITILSTTLTKKKMNYIGLSRFNEQIYEYFYTSAKYLGLLTIMCVIGLAAPKEEYYSSTLLYIVVLLSLNSTFFVYKAIKILRQIIIIDTSNSETKEDEHIEPDLPPVDNGDLYKAEHLN